MSAQILELISEQLNNLTVIVFDQNLVLNSVNNSFVSFHNIIFLIYLLYFVLILFSISLIVHLLFLTISFVQFLKRWFVRQQEEIDDVESEGLVGAEC